MVHCNKKTRRSSGFTMVELMVVLAIMAILAALVGGGLIAYTRLARFEKNEANARTLFQTAQIALTRRDTAGELDDFRQKVLLNGQAGAHFDPAALTLTGEENEETRKQKADELNKNIYALYYDKVTDDDSDNELLRELLGDYIYDDSLLNAAICVEIDAASGQVYSVFYDTNADKLRFVEKDGATNIYNRSYDHRRHDSLVGYYSAEDRVNVVELQQTKLKVKNPRLSNTETLTLSWGGDVTRDTQVQYVATGYSEDGTKKLFEIEVELPAVKTNEPVPLKTTIYSYDAAGNETPVEKTLYYPLSYNKGNFVLTLDAMASADLLRSCENDSGEKANSISVTDSSLYSITRLMSGGPQDFYVTLQAKARDGYSGSYTPSTPADTNVENSLFAKEATATEGKLTYFRHLYNLRWADNWASAQTADYTLAAQSLGATGLNWTGGSVTVYCPAQGKNFPPEAKVPSAEEAVAWPTILTLPKNVTLDGGNITIMNLQLRGSSVSQTGRQGKTALLDRYIGLVGENNGTIKNMTLRDADVQVNVEIVTRAGGTLPLTGTTALQPLETTDSAYRDIRAVGALCGVNTGTLESCTLTHGKNNAVSAQVLAMLPFDDTATTTARTTVNGTAYYENEPRGIGGLVGVAIPKNGQMQRISALTVDANVTVAGLLQDKSLKDADETLTEQARYAAAASGENSIWRSIGVGGVVGTMDAANLKLEADPINKKTITNKATVIGSAFTGGVVGNLYNSNSSSVDVTLTGLQNEGTVSVGANYLGSAGGENSRVLGQFFGGIAGYCKNITLRGSTSTTRRDMTETQLKTAVKGGYANDGALTDDSPLKGDFVGGLVGFASGCKLENCTTQKGYVLGRCFVGGMAGGFSGSQLKITGGSNSSTVLGNRYVGGVVSVNGSQSMVSGVTNSGLVAGLGKNAAYVGGIAGLNDAEWGSNNAANTTATIQNCVSSMASDTATNSSRSALLQALSTYKNASNQETTTRADYVGGLVGRNGKNAVLTWDNEASTVQIGAVICGNDFVGGLVGCNDATAKITNDSTSLLTVSGEVTGGKAVGGMIGLNLAPALPAADIKVTEISGTLCVGGVIGANMPVAAAGEDAFTIKETATSGGTVSTFKTTAKAGRIKADGLAGGIIGYNCLLASAPNDLTTILPTVAEKTGLVTVNTLPRSDKEMTLSGAANQFNLEVNAYVGGIVGYNDAETRLTISNATNGSQSNAASVGSLKMRGETGTLGSGVSLQDYNNSFNYNAYVSSKDARGSMAGGIIGCVTQNTKLESCTNYGIVSHKSAAGGIAGWNGGSIKNCSTYATLGTQQDGYAYLGGIVGINNGTVTDSAPAASITVRGRYIIGGVAGLNLTNASITYNTSDNAIPVTVQANECAGGVAGVNCGNIALGSTTLRVNITAESYAGGIAGSNNMRNATTASIAGGKVTGTVTATKNYAGGAAGANYAEIADVTLIGGARVRANDQFAGGIAGSNRAGTNGQIGTITGCTNTAGQTGNNYTVYATNGNAGGIAGSNESGAQIVDSVVGGVKIGVAKCDAAGIAANNFGIIQGGTVGSCDITFAGESIGAVTAINNEGATISGVTLSKNAAIAFHGPATNVGGIAGKNAGTIGNCNVNSPALNLSGLTARADSISLGGAAGVNTQDATISETTVTLNITDNLNKYKNLGGVAGENAGGGTLLKCTYQGALGKADTAANITTGAANVLDTVGGIVGLNNGEVNGCNVPKITLQVMGASGLSDSQTYAEKLKSASSVGGIAGRNNSTITSCYVATAKDSGSIITARYGFVGGVAGANNGSISSSGSGAKEVTELVNKVKGWFAAGSTNDMISKLKGTAYNNIKGVDTVSTNHYNNVYATGLSQNDLLIGLRGTTTTNGKSSGYLGGVAGFNTVNGTITGAATGKWFVYGDNTTEESKIGGMIGMNEATGEVKLLVNCAAVRRFTRTDRTNDDDTTHRKIEKIAYVGGVIGVQQNTTDDKWVISECVNLGTVFDSGSNYIGGIIASWLKNGGTIEKSFNFGSLSTNTNYGNGSGTVGGIVGFFDQPTPGGTANILSCQNHGDILSCGNWEGDKKHGANDVAGILGKVVMADGANDYLRINIVDCVNGDVSMWCESLAAGIMGWLGPYGNGGTKIPDKVEVYIDRCRNYATDVTIYHKSNDTNLFAGICGNRGNGSATSASTTVTNCFALYKNTVSTNNAPIAMNRGRENIVAYGNYFMDENSFEEKKIAALLKLTEGTPSGEATANEGRTYGTSCKNHYNYGTRLYAGIDNSIESGNRFFAAGMMTNTRDLNTVDTTKCYIIPAANEKLATIYYTGNPGASDINNKNLATILLWYSDKDKISGPSMKDITDDLIQNYYTQVLDKRGPGTVSDLQVAHKKDSSAVYGRYEVTWTAADTEGIFPDNQIQNVSHYLVTLYKVDGNSKTPLENYQNIKVYGTRYLFDADDALANAIGTGQFCVGVKAVNGTATGAEEMSAAQYFVRPLPTPKLEIRLKKQDSSGQAYGQYLVLTNASDYQNAGNWQVTAYLMNQPNTEITLSADNTEAPIANGLGSATRLRATATPGTGATGAWMESARYDEEIGIPVAKANTNSGLVHGKAFDTKNVTMGQPVITGSTADNLSITVTLQFTADTIPNTVPNYRVMLVGKYTGDEQISNAAEDTTATNAQPLKGQYVTLAALEKPVYSSGTEFVLSNLPAVVFDGSYTDLKVISVPIDAGYPQVVTRWEITADEALKAIGEGNNNPVSWNNGIEIVRDADGKFSYYHLTPLQFFASRDSWYNMAAKQIRKDDLNLTLLKAPTVSDIAKGDVDTADNKLNYTFTWTQYKADGSVDTSRHDYDVTLYGLLTQKTGETTTIAGKEKIELKDGVSLADKTTFDTKTGTYTLTLCVDDDLASGSWRYDTVRLHVTRKPDTGDTNAIGLAGEADCTVKQRLSAVGQVNSIMRTNDNSANALNYDITWPASADAKGENTVTYTLYAEKLDGNTWTALADWPGITKNSCTVDLEKYQGETLRFYVVANAVDESKYYCSPNGEYSNLLVVEKRLAAPKVTTAALSYTAPSQTQFLTEEKLTLTVDNSASSGSYYYMGYLFKDAADYKQIAKLASDWQAATNGTDNKAQKLAALTNALNDMLTDTAGRVLRLLPEGRMDGGAQAETTTGGAAFALGDESFTMKPEYAGYWLLPALRSMSTDGTTASSNWYYYVADGLSEAPTQMQLPKIKLDAPQTNQNAFTTVDSKATLQLFGADGETPWTPASTEADISRFAVEWNAVNYSKETGEGLADKYQLEITSADGKTTDKITFTVAKRNVMDEDGTITTKCGEILSVTKEVAIQNETYTITILPTKENGRTFYDLTTTVETDEKGAAVLDENKNPVLATNHVTLDGHYELKDASGTPRYKLETFATLEYLDRDGEPGYRVTLPDLVDLLHKDDTRQRITDKVTVLAEGDAEKTTQSEKLELTVPNDGTAAALTLTAEEQPAQDAAAEQSPAAAPPVLRAARVLRATPETAAAEKEELPAVG